MKLTNLLGRSIINGKPISRAEFFCEFCQTKVIKSLSNGKNNKSCGCNQHSSGRNSSHYKHGETNTRLYRIWGGMKGRCDPNTKHKGNKKWYVGIKVCDEWANDYLKFKEWAAPKYKPGLILDRIDGKGNYCPENCRFVTSKQSADNQGRVHRVKALFPQIQKALNNGWHLTKIQQFFNISMSTVKKYIDKGLLNRKDIFPGKTKTQDIILQVQYYLDRNYTLKEISNIFNISSHTIRYYTNFGYLVRKPALYPHIRRLIPQLQTLLNQGKSILSISKQLDINRKTIYKCIEVGYVTKPKQYNENHQEENAIQDR